MNIFKKKEGFTLVEMLIVIFIIAMLSTLAINGYTEYRRTALLDFAADSFTAQFYELRDKTTHGDFGASDFDDISSALKEVSDGGHYNLPENKNVADCYGLYLRVNGSEYSIQKFEISYINKRQFISETGEWSPLGCDYSQLHDPALSDVFSDFGLDKEISVLGIYDENGIVLGGDMAVTFVPPDGKIHIESQNLNPSAKINIEMKYGKSDEKKYRRNILIDLLSGQINVTRFEYAEA